MLACIGAATRTRGPRKESRCSGWVGWETTSLAARLCERMAQHERLIWVGPLDERRLTLTMKQLRDPHVHALLSEKGPSLKERLVRVLKGPRASKPVLFVFDDFEANLEAQSNGGYEVQQAAREVLDAVLAATHGTASTSRILTSRMRFPSQGPPSSIRNPSSHFRASSSQRRQGC